MEYTKDRWEIKIDKEPACITIVSNKGYKIATIHPFGAYREMPNAHLIVAAPELYEALKEVYANWGTRDLSNDTKLERKIKSALAKTEGK